MLNGRVILVTGASRGIGAATARLLAERGARVGLLSRSSDRIDAIAGELREGGGEAVAIPCDVGSDESVANAVAALRASFGPIACVVNNAGVIQPIGRLGETDPRAWADNISVNILGAYHVTRAALPDLVALGGVIVNVSSGAALRPFEGWSAYCAAKAGLMMLTQALDLEYREVGVSIYGLRPGVVDTDMQGDIRASGINAVSRMQRSSLTPASEPARAIAWLLAERPVDLRGQHLDVRDEAVRVAAGLDRVSETHARR